MNFIISSIQSTDQGRPKYFFIDEAWALLKNALRLSHSIIPIQHDIRNPLPLDDASFDACYSHMLYSMALGTPELERLSQEVWRGY